MIAYTILACCYIFLTKYVGWNHGGYVKDALLGLSGLCCNNLFYNCLLGFDVGGRLNLFFVGHNDGDDSG